MILEVAIISIKSDLEESFEGAVKEASQHLMAATGYVKHTLQKGIEEPEKYILMVTWEKLEDHTVGFRQSQNFVEWRNHIQQYFSEPPKVEHFETPFLAMSK